ncbi:MAG: DNA repair protein RecO [Anaerolineae bacterium]
MERERLYRTEALILHRTDFGEADRLLHVLTPRLGRLRLLAKGVRKLSSRKAGHVELFTHVNLLVARGSTFDIVSQAEVLEPFRQLHEDLERASMAYYVGELVIRFTEEQDENAPLFHLTLNTFDRLCTARDPLLALRFFELHTLELTGYRPQLYFCVACQRHLEPVLNYFSPPLGGVLCPRHKGQAEHMTPLTLPTFKVLRYMQTESWEQVATLRLNSEIHMELESHLRDFIVHVLERQLKSVEFIHRLRRELHRNTLGHHP